MRLPITLSLIVHTIFISAVFYTYTNSNNKNKDLVVTVADFFIDIPKENFIHKTDYKYSEEKENIKQEKIKNNITDTAQNENADYKDILCASSKETQNSDYLNSYISLVESGVIDGVVLKVPPYPAYAKKMGMTGKSVIDILINEDGKIESVDVAISSGYKILDNSAKETIIKSWRLPAPGKKIVVRKIFDFELID